jgi:hypothetical protein
MIAHLVVLEQEYNDRKNNSEFCLLLQRISSHLSVTALLMTFIKNRYKDVAVTLS